MQRGTDLLFPYLLFCPTSPEKINRGEKQQSSLQVLFPWNLRMTNSFPLFFSSFLRWWAHYFPLRNKMSGKLIPECISLNPLHLALWWSTVQCWLQHRRCKLIHIGLFTKSSAIFCNNLICSFSLSFYWLTVIQIFQNRDHHSRTTQTLDITCYANLTTIY